MATQTTTTVDYDTSASKAASPVRQILVQTKEGARKQQELNATVVQVAEADRKRAIIQAEAAKSVAVLQAEAQSESTIRKAEGEKQATVLRADGDRRAASVPHLRRYKTLTRAHRE